MEKLKLFAYESACEVKRVNWPTLNETGRLTSIVIAMSLIVAVFLGAFDTGFFFGLNYLLNLNF